jgi:hypothetical protein
MKFFTNLKRLLEPRTQPPAETTRQPTADRPPPPGLEPSEVAPVPAEVDDVSEVRALLEAVAEAPVISAEPAVETPEPSAPSPQASIESPPDVPSPAPETIGDGLVLTLAMPAATFAVAKASATIGRGQENTIRLDDLSVSRRHARIAYRQGGYWVSDLGSMGGTWVEGTRLSAPRRLVAGEVIDIGLCRLAVSFAGDAPKEKKRATTQRSELAESRRRR